MFSLLLAVIYLAFVSIGLPDSLLGSAWPVMHVDVGAGVSDAGTVTMVISVCTIIASLTSDKVTHRLGSGLVIAISAGLTAIAMLLFSFATEFWHLLIFAIPYGLGAGAIDAALNNYAALHLKAKHMSWLHCFWGIGATLSPYIMGFALSGADSWHGGYRFVAYIQFGLTFLLFMAVPIWKKVASQTTDSNFSVSESEESIVLPLKEVFKLPCALPLFIAFFFYCSIEQLPFVYASSYFVEVFTINEETAAFLASLFYIGMTVSRGITGFLTAKLSDKQLVRIGILIVFFSSFLILLPLQTPICAIIGFVLIGLGCGPIYPSIMHETPNIFGRKVSGSVIGVQMAFAYTNTTLMPFCFGKLSDVVGLWILPLCIIIFSVIVFVLTEKINKHPANKSKALE